MLELYQVNPALSFEIDHNKFSGLYFCCKPQIRQLVEAPSKED